MPPRNNDIGTSYLDRRDNTPNDALKRILDTPDAEGPAKPKQAPQEELPLMAKYPNLYGMYGAVKEVGKSLLPWVKYIDPEERDRFSKLTTDQQTYELLLEDLNFAVMGRWKPIAEGVKSIGGAALETFLPKTYATLIKPRGMTGALKPEIKPVETSPVVQGNLATKEGLGGTSATAKKKASVESSTSEKVEPAPSSKVEPEIVADEEYTTLLPKVGETVSTSGDKSISGKITKIDHNPNDTTDPMITILIDTEMGPGTTQVPLKSLSGDWRPEVKRGSRPDFALEEIPNIKEQELAIEASGRKGLCYKFALDTLRDDPLAKGGTYVTGKYNGVDHAWIEKGNSVYEPVQNIWIKKPAFYKDAEINVSHSLSSEVALDIARTTKKYPSPKTIQEHLGIAPPDVPVLDADDAFKKVQDLANQWDDIIEAQRRGTRPHELARKEGELLGMTDDDARAIAPGTAMNDGQASALINVVNDVASQVHGLAKIAAESGKPEDMNAFLTKFLALGEVDPARWGVRTESGRSLSIMNEPISGINQYLDQFSNALKAAGNMTPERLAKMVSELKDVGSLAKMAAKGAKQGPVDMLMELWINGLLSGPVSHSANVTGNSLTIALQPAVRLGSAISGAVLPGEQTVPFGESVHMIYGMLSGLKDAFRLSGKALLKGESTGEATKMDWRKAITSENMGFDEESGIGRAIDLLGETVRLPGRFLMGEDEFFKAIAYRMEVHARAYREGVANGFEGAELSKFIAQETRNPSSEIKDAALEFGKYVTFQKELGATGQALQNLVATHPTLKIILPFVRTPANIFKVAGEMTPLAPFSKAVRADIAEGGAKRDLALSKIALGTSIMSVVASYVADGRITGAGPSNKDMKAALMRTGWQPYSIKIGDTYHQYGRIEPIATLVGIAASSAELMGAISDDDVKTEKIPSAIIASISKNVVDKTFLQGITKIIEALEDPDRYGARYIQGLAGTAVPALSAQIQRSLDKDVKAVNSVLDSVKSRVPGFAKDLPQRLDLWGEPIALDTWGPMIISPVRKSDVKQSIADTEIVKHKVQISLPEKEINGVELTPQEYNRYVELAGKDAKGPNGLGAKDAVENMIGSIQYQRQSDGKDGGKAMMLKSMIYQYRELARAKIIEEFPELSEKVRLSFEKKKANLMPNF